MGINEEGDWLILNHPHDGKGATRRSQASGPLPKALTSSNCPPDQFENTCGLLTQQLVSLLGFYSKEINKRECCKDLTLWLFVPALFRIVEKMEIL